VIMLARMMLTDSPRSSAPAARTRPISIFVQVLVRPSHALTTVFCLWRTEEPPQQCVRDRTVTHPGLDADNGEIIVRAGLLFFSLIPLLCLYLPSPLAFTTTYCTFTTDLVLFTDRQCRQWDGRKHLAECLNWHGIRQTGKK